jgi:glycosyltransferase involved in cell wall biosynthesis
MAGAYSVVIPTFNRRETLQIVLRALGRQDARELLGEVVVVDDGSSDGTAGAVRGLATSFPLRVLEGRRGGPAAARNAGIEAAEGRYVLFLCDDIEPTPALLRKHHERRHGMDEPHCVVGRVDWAPNLQVTHFMRFVMANYHFGFERFTCAQLLPFDGFITANLSISRELLLEHGGFDEDFSYGFEDTELGLRMSEAGVSILYAPEALGLHHHELGLASYCRRQYAVGRSAAHFVRKHPDRPEVTGAHRLPRPGSMRWCLTGLLLNRLTVHPWRWLATAGGAVGLLAPAERLYFQILSHYYYRGMAAGLRATGHAPGGGCRQL